MARKTGFRFSEALFRFLTRQLDVDTLIRLKRILRAKQGKSTSNSILRSYSRLCRQPTYALYINDWLREDAHD